MTTPLVKQIAKLVKQGLSQAKALEAATLLRPVAGARLAGNLSGGTQATYTSISCQGFVSDEQHEKIGATLVDSQDRIVCLVGLTVVPTTNDRITIDGLTQNIIDLEGNPALWTCLCRGR